MVLSDWKDIAAILGIGISVATYATNSYYQRRNLRVENLRRFFEAHDRLLDVAAFLWRTCPLWRTTRVIREVAPQTEPYTLSRRDTTA